jgi:hypothetical protein
MAFKTGNTDSTGSSVGNSPAHRVGTTKGNVFLKKNSRLNRFKITKKKTLRPQQGHCKTARLGWATFMFREDTGHPTHASVFFLVLAPVSETNRASSMVSLGCARSFFVANGCARSMTEDRE